MLPKLGRMLLPSEMPGRELPDGLLTLGRDIGGRLAAGQLLIPSEGREADAPELGRVEGRLLTLGSEGRDEGIETPGREVAPPLGRDMLGLGRDMPPPGRPPPIPIEGRPAAPPRPDN